MRTSKIVLVGAALMALGPMAARAKTGAAAVDPTDKAFMTKAATGGLLEVELGKLAQQKASSDEVKTFGQRMVDDHSKANDELKAIAQQNGVTLPADVPAQHQKDVDRLSALSGPAFDREYMSMMLKDHVQDVAEFQKEAKRPQNTAAKQFAANTLPTLKEHLQLAKETNAKVAGGAKHATPSRRSAHGSMHHDAEQESQ